MEFDDDDLRYFDSYFKGCERDNRNGPCEDDYEFTMAYINMLPDESDKEYGSPLNFD